MPKDGRWWALRDHAYGAGTRTGRHRAVGARSTHRQRAS